MPKKIGNLTLYTVAEIADELDVQEVTIRRFLREGRLNGRKLAKRWYVTEDALRAYFENRDDAAAG